MKDFVVGVLQGSVNTSDIPQLEQDTIATFADDTVILALDKNRKEFASKLQTFINYITNWTKSRRIKLRKPTILSL